MPAITYCDDSMMAYQASRKKFQSGERIVFDEPYRLAHLPLVNPDHPGFISQVEGRDYLNGRYEKARHALVIPIAPETLLQSESFQTLDRTMRSACFAPKIAWDLCERRRSRLHATLAGGFAEADLDRVVASVQQAFDQAGPVSICLKGPFIGDRNFGRIYFPVYPQQIEGRTRSRWCRKASASPQRDSTSSATITSQRTRRGGDGRACRTDRPVVRPGDRHDDRFRA
jgi:hypothetical protein